MKKFIAIVLAVLMIISLVGCNYTLIDTNYKYDRAIIELADGEVVEVEIARWTDYDGEQLQIEATDGTVYLTNSFRCDLIRDKE